MDADDLVLFDVIVCEGGLSAAARKLGWPKATVSRRLMRLEAAVGAPLFDRFGRKLRLTQAGEILRGPSRAMGVALSEARALTTAALEPSHGTIRIVSPFLFGKLVLSPLLGSFLAERERVQAVLRFDNALIDPLRDNFDLAIRIGLPREGYLIARKLASAPLGLYAPPTLAPKLQSAADLEDVPFIQVANEPTETALIPVHGNAKIEAAKVKVVCTVNDPEAACMIVAGGAGVGILPAFLAMDFVTRGELIHVLPGLKLGHVDLFAVMPPGRNAIPLVAEFLKALRTQIGRKGLAQSSS